MLWLGVGTWHLTPGLLIDDLTNRYWGQSGQTRSITSQHRSLWKSSTGVVKSQLQGGKHYLFIPITFLSPVHRAVMHLTLFYPLPWQQRSHPMKNVSVSIFVFTKNIFWTTSCEKEMLNSQRHCWYKRKWAKYNQCALWCRNWAQ